MDAKAHGWMQRAVDPCRLLRIDVVMLHEVARLVGADRNHREAEWPMPGRLADPAAVAEAGVAGEIDLAARQGDGDAGPQRTVAVGAPARSPMMVALDDNL